MKDKMLSMVWSLVMVIIGCGLAQTTINLNKYLKAQTAKAYVEIEVLKHELAIYKEQDEIVKKGKDDTKD